MTSSGSFHGAQDRFSPSFTTLRGEEFIQEFVVSGGCSHDNFSRVGQGSPKK